LTVDAKRRVDDPAKQGMQQRVTTHPRQKRRVQQGMCLQLGWTWVAAFVDFRSVAGLLVAHRAFVQARGAFMLGLVAALGAGQLRHRVLWPLHGHVACQMKVRYLLQQRVEQALASLEQPGVSYVDHNRFRPQCLPDELLLQRPDFMPRMIAVLEGCSDSMAGAVSGLLHRVLGTNRARWVVFLQVPGSVGWLDRGVVWGSMKSQSTRQALAMLRVAVAIAPQLLAHVDFVALLMERISRCPKCPFDQAGMHNLYSTLTAFLVHMPAAALQLAACQGVQLMVAAMSLFESTVPVYRGEEGFHDRHAVAATRLVDAVLEVLPGGADELCMHGYLDVLGRRLAAVDAYSGFATHAPRCRQRVVSSIQVVIGKCSPKTLTALPRTVATDRALDAARMCPAVGAVV
jgi:hypothetical protein